MTGLLRPCTACAGGRGPEFKLQTGEVLRVAYGDGSVPAAVGVLHASGEAFYVCDYHRKELVTARAGTFELMADFEARVLAADAVHRLKGE